MKKIMFNDRYGLTKAVLDGRKTMTRRIIPPIEIDWNRRGKVTLPVSCFRYGTLFMDASAILERDFEYPAPAKYQPKYNAGEIVAVAQSYKDTGNYPESYIIDEFHPNIEFEAGWNNKRLVRADLMPHRIRITNVRVERLQDISDEDCLREGIIENTIRSECGGIVNNYTYKGAPGVYVFPREAFSALINRLSGKGTWDSNPWVFVYEFELVM